MKTLRLLLAAMLTAWAAVAAATPPGLPASLSVYSEQGQAFSFALDGRSLMRPMARQLRVGLLPPGQHWADVSVFTPYGPPVRFRASLWLQPGIDNSFVLVLRRSGPQLRPVQPGPVYGGQYPPAGPAVPYPGQVPAAPGTYAPPAPGYPSGPAYPATPAPGAYPGSPAYPGTPAPGTYPGSPAYPAMPAPGAYPSSPAYPATPAPGAYPGGGVSAPGQPGGYPPSGSYPAPGNGGYYPDGNAYLPPLSPADFDGLQRAVAQRPFDDERLSIAKQALGQSMVRADQLAVLIRALSFDKSRTNLAEFGYAHVADPQNFYLVYDALQYRSSIREVQQALGLPQN